MMGGLSWMKGAQGAERGAVVGRFRGVPRSTTQATLIELPKSRVDRGSIEVLVGKNGTRGALTP